MNVNYTFRNLESSDAVKSHLEKGLHRLDKYCPFDFEAQATFHVERHNHFADININANGILMRGESSTSDLYASIDMAIDKIEKQLKKHKSRLTTIKTNRKKNSKKVNLDIINQQQFKQPEKTDELEIESQEVTIRPMSTEEAIIQMDLLNSDIFVFSDDSNDVVKVLYRRKDNDYGLISAVK